MRDLSIPLGDGRETAGTVYEPSAPRDSLLVLAHGAGAGRRHPFMVAAAQGLANRGIHVMTFDFPYMHDRRKVPDRTPVLESSFRSAIAAAMSQPGLAGRALFLGGKSMGGRMATHLGAQQDGVSGIVVLGYPLHPPGKPDQLRVSHWPAIAVPLLIVQGERDPFGTPAEFDAPLTTMPRGATLHVVPGGDHSLAVRGRGQAAVFESVLDTVAEWMMGIGDRR